MRVKSNLSAEEEAALAGNTDLPNYRPIERDTFELNAAYRDPFGTTPKMEATLPQDAPFRMEPAPIPRKVEAPWPAIKYYGLVRKTNSNDPLGIVSIDGMQLHLRKGDAVFDDVQIKSITRDSVVVQYKKNKRTFYRN